MPGQSLTAFGWRASRVVGDGGKGGFYTMYPSANQYQGKSFPLGATLSRDGVNFSVFSKHSAAAQLLLFDHVEDPKPSRVIPLEPQGNRTYHYWHAFIPG